MSWFAKCKTKVNNKLIVFIFEMHFKLLHVLDVTHFKGGLTVPLYTYHTLFTNK